MNEHRNARFPRRQSWRNTSRRGASQVFVFSVIVGITLLASSLLGVSATLASGSTPSITNNEYILGAQSVYADGSHVWVGTASNVLEIDPTTFDVLATIPVGNNPISLYSDGVHLWVTSWDNDSLTEIDIATQTVVNTISVGDQPAGVFSNGTDVWVANWGDNNVEEISVTSGLVVRTINVGERPHGLVGEGSYIWVDNQSSSSIMQISESTGEIVQTVTLSGSPYLWNLSADSSNVWVSEYNKDLVAEVSISSGEEIRTVSVGDEPQGIVDDGTNIWVGNSDSSSLTEINGSTGVVANTVSGFLALGPTSISTDGESVWAVEQTSDRLYQIAIPAAVTQVVVTANSPSAVTYGTNIPSIGFTPSVTTDWTGSAVPTCAVYSSSDVEFDEPLSGIQPAGTYVTHCAGGGDTNYAVSSYASGSFHINAAHVTVTAAIPNEVTYETALPRIGYSTSGATEWSTSADPTCAVYATSDSTYAHPLSGVQPAGTYVTHCAGGGDGNVVVTGYVNGSVRVVPAVLAGPKNLYVTDSKGVVLASFTSVPYASAYRCTLMYGFHNPSSFAYVSTMPSCEFDGVGTKLDLGVQVIALNPSSNFVSSLPVVGFQPGTTVQVVATHPMGTIYFSSNVATLTSAAQSALRQFVSAVISSNQHQITVAGYKDWMEARSGAESLGARRASVVSNFLTTLFANTHYDVTISQSGLGVDTQSRKLALDRRVTLKS